MQRDKSWEMWLPMVIYSNHSCHKFVIVAYIAKNTFIRFRFFLHLCIIAADQVLEREILPLYIYKHF